MVWRLLEIKETFLVSYSHLNNLEKGVENVLFNRLLKYDPKFEGFLMAWKDIQILTHQIPVQQYPSVLCVDANVKILAFRPTEGETLRGNVNFISPDYIRMTVFGIFSAKLNVPKEFKNAEGKILYFDKNAIHSGDHVTFTTEKVVSGQSMFDMEGTLSEKVKITRYESEIPFLVDPTAPIEKIKIEENEVEQKKEDSDSEGDDEKEQSSSSSSSSSSSPSSSDSDSDSDSD